MGKDQRREVHQYGYGKVIILDRLRLSREAFQARSTHTPVTPHLSSIVSIIIVLIPGINVGEIIPQFAIETFGRFVYNFSREDILAIVTNQLYLKCNSAFPSLSLVLYLLIEEAGYKKYSQFCLLSIEKVIDEVFQTIDQVVGASSTHYFRELLTLLVIPKGATGTC